jgi:hypothetical protein
VEPEPKPEPWLVKKSEPEPEPELDIKLWIWFPSLSIFSFTFYNKFVDIYNLFACKTAYYVKRKQIFKEKFAFYGIDVDLEPELEPEP